MSEFDSSFDPVSDEERMSAEEAEFRAEQEAEARREGRPFMDAPDPADYNTSMGELAEAARMSPEEIEEYIKNRIRKERGKIVFLTLGSVFAGVGAWWLFFGRK